MSDAVRSNRHPLEKMNDGKTCMIHFSADDDAFSLQFPETRTLQSFEEIIVLDAKRGNFGYLHHHHRYMNIIYESVSVLYMSI